MRADELPVERLALAGDNADAIAEAWRQTPDDQRPGMRFLIKNMPQRDLESLSAEFLLEHVDYAYRAWREAPWRDSVSEAMFLNNVLPYANVTERRERWRKDFYERFRPLVANAKSPSEAAARLNNQLFAKVGVKYSTKRRRADQSPHESIETGLASCTGLSILLIDACRAVGVPARFVGTPLWSDRSGNHSWVEIWDDGWHFTGAAEPTGDELDRGWFVDKASKAQRDKPLFAVYAVSFKQTPLEFPCVWARDADYVHAVNVTDRYARIGNALPEGTTFAQFRAIDPASGERQSCRIRVADSTGAVLLDDQTKDERFDANDHAVVPLMIGETYRVTFNSGAKSEAREITVRKPDELFTFTATGDAADSIDDPIAALERYLQRPPGERSNLDDLPFAKQALSRVQAKQARALLWNEHAQSSRDELAAELDAKVIKAADREMPIWYATYGKKPKAGRSLYISLHGGGGAPSAVNDRQWKNQQRLYKPAEGVYVAPRAPTDDWNLWHQSHIDALFERLIEAMVLCEGVDRDRVYLLGYSAGGDGVYQLAPRMADRWAACAMMAGHPNDASPLGLRNIGFALYMGGRDAAYDRNKVAGQWKQKLAELRQTDPNGYEHLVTIYPEKGHWMDGEDASAIDWLAKFTRNPIPKKVVWRQDDVRRSTFYWLAADAESLADGATVTATIDGQRITLDSQGFGKITVRLDDRLVDSDENVTIVDPAGATLFNGAPQRTIAMLAKTLRERRDPELMFSAAITVALPAPSE